MSNCFGWKSPKRSKDIHSRGNQQKTAVACALSLGSEVLLLDEPTMGMDIETARSMMETVSAENKSGRIVIVSTHDTEFIELDEDEIVLFRDGFVSELGSPASITAGYENGDGRFSTSYLNLIRK